MSKKNLNVSSNLVKSLLYAFLTSFLFMFITHVIKPEYPNRSYSEGPQLYGNNDEVMGCAFRCIFNELHNGSCQGLTNEEVDNKTPSFKEIWKAIFNEHFKFASIIVIIVFLLLYLPKVYNLKITE